MRIILSLLFFSFVYLSYSEAYEIQGQLFERGTRKPLAETNVFLLPQKLKAVTDKNGKFKFGQIESIAPPLKNETNTEDEDDDDETPSQCRLIINLTGYQKLEEELDCNVSEKELVLYLEKVSYSQFETTVVSKAPTRDATQKSLSQEKFLSMPGSFGGDPVRASQNLPGVAQSGGSAEVIVQGASPDDTGYSINGHRVPIIFHFGGLASVLAPQAVDRVELRPSGYGPEYSRAIGGIINLETKQPREDRKSTTAYVDLLNIGALNEGPIDEKRSYFISGRYSYIGNVLKRVSEESDDVNIDSAPVYGDITGIYRKKINKKWTYDNTMIWSRDDIKFIINRAFGDDPALKGNFKNTTQFYRFIPRLTGKLSDKTTVTHSLGIGNDKIIIDIGSQYLNINRDVISHRSELEYKLNDHHQVFVGMDNEFDRAQVKVNLPSRYDIGGVDNPFSAGENRRFETDSTDTNLGAYWRYNWTPNKKWMFGPHARFDYFSETGDTVAQPRVQARYSLSEDFSLNASVGEYAQAPEPQETSEDYGNRDLKPLESTHYTVGWERNFAGKGKKGFSILNNFFYKDLRNLVIPDIASKYTNDGTGEIFGMEIQTSYEKERFSGQLVYTYLDSKRSIPGAEDFPAQFDQTHNFNLIAAYQLNRWSFSMRYRYVSGNPFTPVSQGIYDSDNDVYIPRRGSLYSERVSDFQQLDLRVERKTIYDTWILSWYIDIQNVLNRDNPSQVDFAYNYSTFTESGGLPILPTFGVKGVF